MDMQEKKISGEVIYKGRVVTLIRDKVLCPNGEESYREVVKHNGGACILGVTKDNKIFLERQYRYAYDEVLYELPAGKLEPNEEPLNAAIREFEEETGYKALKMELLGIDYPTCGYSNERLYLFYTNDFVKTKTNFDSDEVIELELVDLNDALTMIKEGKIKDGKTINAIMLYLLKENKISL